MWAVCLMCSWGVVVLMFVWLYVFITMELDWLNPSGYHEVFSWIDWLAARASHTGVCSAPALMSYNSAVHKELQLSEPSSHFCVLRYYNTLYTLHYDIIWYDPIPIIVGWCVHWHTFSWLHGAVLCVHIGFTIGYTRVSWQCWLQTSLHLH